MSNTKMTTLDALSTMDVNADILFIRAQYWEGVADRHIRANRHAQADRLIAAAKKMRAAAKEMLRAEKAAAKAAKIASLPAPKGKKIAPDARTA